MEEHLKGIEVLCNGVIKRVWDGTSIEVWTDPWLPHNWSRAPITPKGNTLIRYADELMDPFQGGWDVQLVNSIF